MMFAFVVAALVATSSAFPATVRSADQELPMATGVFESIAAPPSGWLKNDTNLDKDTATIDLRIQLVHQNMNQFHELATNIATPGHELYGKHLSQSVIDSMIAPKSESKDLVLSWLGNQSLAGAASISSRGDAIILKASISQAEQLLGATYSVYNNEKLGDSVIRTLAYSLPRNLLGHVSMVQPTTLFGLRIVKPAINQVSKGNVLRAVTATGCTNSVTPSCIAAQYSITSSSASLSSGKMGISGFLGEYPSKSDLKTFLGQFATTGNTGETYTCTTVNDGKCPTNPSSPGGEANLDVQYARALTQDIPNVYYSTGGSPPIVGSGANDNEPYLEFLDYFLNLTDAELPNTLSISYGDDESTVPLSYADETCNLFSQLGARGVSVLVAGGDSGVGNTCTVNGKTQFTTSFPASCPWVTTVGGTQGSSPEKAWADGGSGFSEVFGQPSYQAAAVQTWLSTNTDKMSAYFNASGRGYPDVAALAVNFEIVISGEVYEVDGTSCATPTFASVIQLLNSERLAAGKTGLGFLNPWLYGNASSALTDITSGKNTGCSGQISGAGFSAITGWDPVTGLGSPNYTKLLAISNAT